MSGDARSVAESVYREQGGRILSTLIRLSGSFDLAEEFLQEALTTALADWPEKGVPSNPPAWITAVAQRRCIDYARRRRTHREKEAALIHQLDVPVEEEISDPMSPAYPDDRLRLLFTCCHPALSHEAQIALTLRTLGGLTTHEIARAFLLAEPTLAQRLVRAKHKIQAAKIPYEIPALSQIPGRLDAVRSVLYLIFNEGYTATAGSALIRTDLCAEAIRLSRLLCELVPHDPENMGLLALLLLQNSRRDARTDSAGRLLTLEHQNRALWHRAEIAEGSRLAERALRLRTPGPYQVQAAIASLHAEAPHAGATDWPQIVQLYRKLLEIAPSAVIALNYAVAVAMAYGPETGLPLLDELEREGSLAEYHLLHAARADLFRRLDRPGAAIAAYRRARSLATNPVEQRFLDDRILSLGATLPSDPSAPPAAPEGS